MLSKASVKNRNWRRDLQRQLTKKMATLNVEDILKNEADSDALRSLSLLEKKATRRGTMMASTPTVTLMPLGM